MRTGRLTSAVPRKAFDRELRCSATAGAFPRLKQIPRATTADATDLTRPVRPFRELREALHRLDELSFLIWA